MTFLFTEDGRDDDVLRAFRRYREYVESAKASVPLGCIQKRSANPRRRALGRTLISWM